MGKLILSTILILIICFHLSMVTKAVAQTAEFSEARTEGPYQDLVTRFSSWQIAFSCHNRHRPSDRQATLSVFIPNRLWGHSKGKAILREALPQEGVKEYRGTIEVQSLSINGNDMLQASVEINWRPARMIKVMVPSGRAREAWYQHPLHSGGELAFDLKTEDQVIDPRENIPTIEINDVSKILSSFKIEQAAQAQYERNRRERYYFPLQPASLNMIDSVTKISLGSFKLQCWMNKARI